MTQDDAHECQPATDGDPHFYNDFGSSMCQWFAGTFRTESVGQLVPAEKVAKHPKVRLNVDFIRAWLRCLACTFLISGNIAVQAEDLEWLYDVEFTVTDQSEPERLDALRDGLEIVLLRITGLRELPDLPLIDEAFNNLDAYQLQFRYEQIHTSINLDVIKHLIINYDQNAIHELIRDAQLPIWSAQRPHVLFLISFVDEDRRTVLNETIENDVQRVIRSTALRRGVSYSQPIMDLDDLVILREGALAFGFVPSLESLRYRIQADLVATVRIDPLTFSQHRVWLSIYDTTGRHSQLFDAGNLETTVAEVVNRTADYLAERYAVTGGEATALHVAIFGISDIAEYKDVLDYLSKWEFIDRVLLSSVKRDRFQFELRTASSWEQLAIYLDEDGVLTPRSTESASVERVPEYVWRDSP